MTRSRGASTPAVVMVVIVILAVATIGYVSFSSLSTTTSESSSPTSTTTSSSSSSETSSSTATTSTTYADSLPGLQLRMSVNTSRIYQGAVMLVNLSEFNTYDHVNNVSKADNWSAPVALGSCPSTNFWPFGVAVYQGHVTSGNISQGKQVQVFPVTPCPLYIRYISAYAFQPNSHTAQIQPGTGVTAMTVTAEITNSTSGGSNQSAPLPIGSYTIVAGDEWGALAFLYFQVLPRPS